MNQELATFLKERELGRVLEAVRVKFERHGVGGTALVLEPTPAEVTALVKLFGAEGRKLVPGPGQPLEVPLRKLEAALIASRFRCRVQDALSAYYGAEVLPRSEQRVREAERLRTFVAGLGVWENERCRRWLEAFCDRKAHTGYVLRIKARGEEESASALATLVLRALASLPADAGGVERLAVFANRVAGDPHAFDEGTPGGLVLLRALEAEFGELVGVTRSRGRADSERVFEAAGLIRDLVSSFVTVAGPLNPVLRGGHPDQGVTMLLGRARIFTLAEVQGWESVASSPVIYVVENPVVFEALCEVGADVTVVCTRGFPSLAAVRLLDLMVRSGGVLRYSGDFDGNGLAIARLLVTRYGDRCEPWRMGSEEYETASRYRGRRLTEGELRRIATMERDFPSLVPAMVERRVSAYQEALVQVLQGDIGVPDKRILTRPV